MNSDEIADQNAKKFLDLIKRLVPTANRFSITHTHHFYTSEEKKTKRKARSMRANAMKNRRKKIQESLIVMTDSRPNYTILTISSSIATI